MIMKHFKAFTLIEIMVVCIIMAVIVGLASNQYAKLMELQRCQNAKQNMLAIWSAIEIYKIKNGKIPVLMYPTSGVNSTLGLNIYDPDFIYSVSSDGTNFYATARRGTDPMSPMYQILIEQMPIEGTNPGCLGGGCPQGCF